MFMASFSLVEPTCCRTEDGDMFVVKDPDLFATQVIPQYFDHNKFSSFARQLNFYGFRKMQSKPIRNSDFDAGTAKHVTFYNENFKRGRCDLLKKIQRSTRGGGTAAPGDQSREVVFLREQVSNLELQVTEVASQMEERIRRLELEMLSRLEQMMITVQQQQRTQLQLEKATSIGSTMSQQNMSMQPPQQQQVLPNQMMQQFQNSVSNNWDINTYNAIRASSISSAANSVANIVGTQPPGFLLSSSLNSQIQQQQQSAPPTLPPHPKQKQLPSGIVPGSMAAPPDRLNSLRGISTLSRGLSGLTRGASVESSASAVLMRNSWEDKFFSMLMLEGNDPGAINDMNLSPTPIGGPVTVSDNSGSVTMMSSFPAKGPISRSSGDDDLSDVSSGDLP
jgi:HSF-type DNA-binding